MASSCHTAGNPLPIPASAAKRLQCARERTAAAEKGWTIGQWCEELAHLRSLSVRHKLGLHRRHRDVVDLRDGSVGVIGQWDQVLLVPRPPPAKVGDTTEGPMLVYADRSREQQPIVEGAVAGPLCLYAGQVDEEPRPPEALKHVGFLLPWDQCPALIVRLDGAPEAYIRAKAIAALDGALRARRAERQEGERLAYAALKRLPTAGAFSRPFSDGKTFKGWCRYKISEVTELLVWRKRLPPAERRPYRDYVLGQWLFGSTSEPREMSEGIQTLKNAIASMRLLVPEQREEPHASVE